MEPEDNEKSISFLLQPDIDPCLAKEELKNNKTRSKEYRSRKKEYVTKLGIY